MQPPHTHRPLLCSFFLRHLAKTLQVSFFFLIRSEWCSLKSSIVAIRLSSLSLFVENNIILLDNTNKKTKISRRKERSLLMGVQLFFFFHYSFFSVNRFAVTDFGVSSRMQKPIFFPDPPVLFFSHSSHYAKLRIPSVIR